MLVLSRKPGENIYLGDDIVIKVLNVRHHHVQLGFEAPKSVRILRDDAKNIDDLAGHLHPAVLTGNVKKNEL